MMNQLRERAGERLNSKPTNKIAGILAGIVALAGCGEGSSQSTQPKVDPYSVEGLTARFAPITQDRVKKLDCKTSPNGGVEFEYTDKTRFGAFVIDVLKPDDSHLTLHLQTTDGKEYRLKSYFKKEKEAAEGTFVRDQKPLVKQPHGVAVRVGHDTDKGEGQIVDFEVEC